MGTPQTTAENVRVALCDHRHLSSLWIAVLSQCWGHSKRGTANTYVPMVT